MKMVKTSPHKVTLSQPNLLHRLVVRRKWKKDGTINLFGFPLERKTQYTYLKYVKECGRTDMFIWGIIFYEPDNPLSDICKASSCGCIFWHKWVCTHLRENSELCFPQRSGTEWMILFMNASILIGVRGHFGERGQSKLWFHKLSWWVCRSCPTITSNSVPHWVEVYRQSTDHSFS